MNSNNKLNIKPKDENLYLPEKATITKIKNFTDKELFFELELQNNKPLGHIPGQFIQLSILGIGEAPISISSPPGADNKFEICVRAVGDVTNKLHSFNVGDEIFIRGPFGHGFDDSIIQKMYRKHILFIAGGIGYVPLRSLINKVLKEPELYEKISILYGCKTPDEIMYKEEIAEVAEMGKNIEFLKTVDHGDENWTGNTGVITTLIPQVKFNPLNTIAIIAGPPVMYKFVLISLINKGMPKSNIYMSLERRMKCGVGKCGHCKMEGIYVCKEGPVFNYADIENNEEVL
ncbi:MAG: oxidoreductase [bacterium]|nr:oxidoreductase [bacterium]